MFEDEDTEQQTDEVGIPERCRVKRRYTLSEAALEQRRKAASSPNHADSLKGNKNAWKHGKYAQNFIESFIRPCHSTCKSYPCELIQDGATQPGGDCLDKASVIDYYRAILEAIQNKKYDGFHEIAALNIAQAIHIVQMLMEDIIRDGTVVKRDRVNKDGKLILVEYVTHPSLSALPKLLADLNLNPAEFLLTPKALSKIEDEEKDRQTLTDMMHKVVGAFEKGQKPEDGK